MKKVLSLFAMVWLTLSANAADPAHVRVLSIGNSFSLDAFSYVPFLMDELAPGTQVDFGILYIGGCRLKRHDENLQGVKADYDFYQYHAGADKWVSRKGVSIQEGMAAEDWDIVILQQQSADSRYYSTYQPYLDHLIDYIHTDKPKAKIAWLLTQAYGEGFGDLKGMVSDEMWARTDEASERVMKETGVNILIPAGTAIQNARYTSLDRFGKFGHLVHDGYHLQEGVAAYIEGLVATRSLLAAYGVDVDVQQSRIKVTHDWWKGKNTPQPHGEPEEATDEEWTIARQCAQWALDTPWSLTIKE